MAPAPELWAAGGGTKAQGVLGPWRQEHHRLPSDRNAVRMQHSTAFVNRASLLVPTDLFLAGVKAAVALNGEYVPPTRPGAALAHPPADCSSECTAVGSSPPEEYTSASSLVPTGVYPRTHPVKALILGDFDRAAPNSTGSAKRW